MIRNIYSAISYFLSRAFFKLILKIFYRYRVIGTENIPRSGPFIMASNHASYLDPPAVGATTRRRIYFMASEHLYKGRLMGWWCDSVGCIKVKRGEPDHRAIRKVLDYLEKGRPVAIFPEGTRSQDGNLQGALSGVGYLAVKSGAPVVPCFVKGGEKALPRDARFLKPARVSIYVGRPLRAADLKGETDKKVARTLFTGRIMEAIAALKAEYGDKTL
jgi:1-acyl-sn-glycerol-3-phosphate acyltransferase